MGAFEDKLIRAVKKKREREGLSIRALAATVGVSFSALARMERGDGEPDNNSKIRLLQWLGDEGTNFGLRFEHVALVHFRADKNIRSITTKALLRAAEGILQASATQSGISSNEIEMGGSGGAVSLSKEELERTAQKFRMDLGLSESEPVDSLKVRVEKVEVVLAKKAQAVEPAVIKHLTQIAAGEWSAMSVPLDVAGDNWVVLLNDSHVVERQRVTLLEEYWHILLGHKLTKIARIGEAYGRTYDPVEEHDAYYLASATLLPMMAVTSAVREGLSSAQTGSKFGVSSELVDYRIKRLGLWREHTGKRIHLSPE